MTGARLWLRRLVMAGGLMLILGIACALALAPRGTTRPDLSAEIVSGSIEHDGLTRRYEVYAPADLEPNRPLVFHIHGSGGRSRRRS